MADLVFRFEYLGIAVAWPSSGSDVYQGIMDVHGHTSRHAAAPFALLTVDGSCIGGAGGTRDTSFADNAGYDGFEGWADIISVTQGAAAWFDDDDDQHVFAGRSSKQVADPIISLCLRQPQKWRSN